MENDGLVRIPGNKHSPAETLREVLRKISNGTVTSPGEFSAMAEHHCAAPHRIMTVGSRHDEAHDDEAHNGVRFQVPRKKYITQYTLNNPDRRVCL